MEDKRMTEQESLQIIHQMIQTAKSEQKDNGMGWIIWGWLLFIACIFTFLNQQFAWVSTFFFWNLFGVITLLLGIYETIQFYFAKINIFLSKNTYQRRKFF